MLGSDSCERCELRIEMRDRRGMDGGWMRGLIRNYRKEKKEKRKFNTSQNKQTIGLIRNNTLSSHIPKRCHQTKHHTTPHARRDADEQSITRSRSVGPHTPLKFQIQSSVIRICSNGMGVKLFRSIPRDKSAG